MSRAYDLHRNGDCDTFCGVCQWEDANDPGPVDEDRYFEADDGEDEPTLWERTKGEPIALLRRCELHERLRPIWHLIVEAVTES